MISAAEATGAEAMADERTKRTTTQDKSFAVRTACFLPTGCEFERASRAGPIRLFYAPKAIFLLVRFSLAQAKRQNSHAWLSADLSIFPVEPLGNSGTIFTCRGYL